MKKRLFCVPIFALILILLLQLCCCNNSNNNENTDDTTTDESSTVEDVPEVAPKKSELIIDGKSKFVVVVDSHDWWIIGNFKRIGGGIRGDSIFDHLVNNDFLVET